ERLALRIESWKSRQKRRVDVQDAVGKRLEQRMPHEPHEAGKTDQVHVSRAQNVHDRAIVKVAARVVPRIQAERLDAGLARPDQPLRVGSIRDDDGDRGLEATVRYGVDDRLEIRSAARNQNRDSSSGKGVVPLFRMVF